MKKGFLLIILLAPFVTNAQLFDGEEYEYTTEWIWGINKNTNGGLIGGFMLRFSRSAGDDFFETYGLELSNVKHPSERRYIGQTGAGFSFPKQNHLYAIRLQYGREKLLFKKSSQQGVQISAMAAAGPTIGLEAPYFINESDGSYAPYDPDIHQNPNSIIGPGRLLQGLGDSKVLPGLNGKTSLLFEFGTYRSNVAGLEAGIMVEGFTRKAIIIPSQPNNSVFTSVFITLFWGSRK